MKRGQMLNVLQSLIADERLEEPEQMAIASAIATIEERRLIPLTSILSENIPRPQFTRQMRGA